MAAHKSAAKICGKWDIQRPSHDTPVVEPLDDTCGQTSGTEWPESCSRPCFQCSGSSVLSPTQPTVPESRNAVVQAVSYLHQPALLVALYKCSFINLRPRDTGHPLHTTPEQPLERCYPVNPTSMTQPQGSQDIQ